ncbi:metallophosphoesterase [Alicyclobacillus fastidiosus]|uniref:Metallophosphoesterase n=1 Tax=Alicyclobacillus fastidiosus TaxID=392011 RepID=A0ABY6ZF83_9BACL|nr:metallophosphoesterase [Alicyclobacillus fastidiosus]WAH41506.1 metallophosphoesterase [Alicyclobacillus fastidiosus]GMA63155.1 hypothetical protein GCM10025859_35950 [Alicyclobacillus fastidiosus]
MRVAFTSDLHFMAWAETLEPVNSVPGLYHALHDISEQNPDILVINGDFTNGKVRDYNLAIRARLLVFLHQPVDNTVANSQHTCFQSEEIRAVLKERPNTFLISGHTHQRMDQPTQFILEDGVPYVGGGCVLDDNHKAALSNWRRRRRRFAFEITKRCDGWTVIKFSFHNLTGRTDL